MIGGSTTTPGKARNEKVHQDSVAILSAASIKQKNKKSVDLLEQQETPSTAKEKK